MGVVIFVCAKGQSPKRSVDEHGSLLVVVVVVVVFVVVVVVLVFCSMCKCGRFGGRMD